MKLSFWSLGMPQTMSELASLAAELGYDGVDLRCTRPVDGRPGDEGNLSIESTEEELAIGRKAFADNGVAIASLLCYYPGGHGARIEDWAWFRDDVRAHARVAELVGAPRVRPTVGSPAAGQSWEDHLDKLFETTLEGLEDTPGVAAIFENHPGTAKARQLLETAARVGNERLGVEFSPDHTLTMQEDTLGLIEEYAAQIAQVCYADRRVVQDDLARFDGRYYYTRFEACLSGEGDVPAGRIFSSLARAGFDGYISFKWERTARFGQELPPHDVALPHFVEYMRQFDDARR